MSARLIPSLTLKKQRLASDPQTSIWVSAHAGSGKTYVLAQRVLRLLLSGVPPSHILCLTYTKAAAANMSTRVFEQLARWVLLDDEALAQAIERTGAPPPSSADLIMARQLFARTVETPGGLKIQTIHAFCERVLHLFPFEANVPAGFSVVDDVSRFDLLARAKKSVVRKAMAQAGALKDAFDHVATQISAQSFDALCHELLFNRDIFSDNEDLTRYQESLIKLFGLRSADTVASFDQEIVLGGIAPERWLHIARQLDLGGVNDKKLGALLQEAFAQRQEALCSDLYLAVFFTKDGAPRGLGQRAAIISKKLSEAYPDLLAQMEAERDRLHVVKEKRKAAALIARSLSLMTLGRAMLNDYQQRKRAQNLLDYDDLIERTRRLLQSSSPSWVMYKLDSQIDHILLDEAQDTSAAQWDILTAIADEFCTGVSARRLNRSFFAVGDEKQSIFSFQGAAPDKFQEMRRALAQKFINADLSFTQIALHQSFRSAPGVLNMVDTVFSHADNDYGLGSGRGDEKLAHEALKTDVPSLIEIWPLIGKGAAAEPDDWRLPVDAPERDDPAERVAEKIALKIKALLDPQGFETVEENGARRAVNASDILILVRQRSAFFEAMIRALKLHQIPVAGADRLNLIDHVAVMDLIALGRVALLVEDDLTLAGLLKSPLIGFDDDDLLDLAPGRAESLYAALIASHAPHHQQAAQKIMRWREDAQSLGPFDFYSLILASHGGRAQLVARLGVEAHDVIDEFVRLALNFERTHSSSLLKFLMMVQSLDLSIKRDMESVHNEVRVMTVHAAKGLEAKIIFLPDSCGAPSGKHDPSLFTLHAQRQSQLVWSLGKESDPEPVRMAREDYRNAERAEHQRLLYVALTRAEERLYIAGFHGRAGPAEGCWYLSILAALAPICETHSDPLYPEEKLLVYGRVPYAAPTQKEQPSDDLSDVPEFARSPAPFEMRASSTLTPSTQYIEQEATEKSLNKARAHSLSLGLLTHELLQYLPACERSLRQARAQSFLKRRAHKFDAPTQTQILSAVLNVLENPQVAQLFTSDSLAEVDVAAVLPSGQTIRGRIDRLAQVDDEIWIGDFKSGRRAENLSTSNLRQMALYQVAVQPLYPEKHIRCFLIWLQDGLVEEVADPMLQDEIARVLGQEARS